MRTSASLTRLNLGCGPEAAAGWLNADRSPGAGIDLVGDFRDGLALPTGSVDYAAAIHVLQDLPLPDIEPVLRELHRVLKRGGWLRLALPDLDRAIDAYRGGDARYFYVPDEHAMDIGAKLVVQIVWYGSVRTPFTFGFAAEWLRRAGFQDVRRAAFGRTASPHDEIASLDNRERESLFVEAIRP